jgi:hypothetical protein
MGVTVKREILMKKANRSENVAGGQKRFPVALELPEWHETVLEEREKRIVAGEAHFTDWEIAKADIRKRCE